MAATTLGAQESKWLLSLSCDLPEEYSTTWVTVDEMLDRLIEGGVDRALTKEHLEYAVQRHNRGGAFLSRRGEGGGVFYCPSRYQYAPGTPIDQQKRHSGQGRRNLPISPLHRGFLLSNPSSAIKTSKLNNALIQLEEQQIRAEATVRVEEKKQASKSHLLRSLNYFP